MNHIKEASKGYNCEHDGLIRPISQIDGEIIQQLQNILALRGNAEDVVEILADWKREDQDAHILDRISLLSMDAEEKAEEEKNKKPLFFHIKDHLINAAEILYIKPISEWRKDRRIYLIIINPEKEVHAKSLIKNIQISFYNEEDRDKAMESLKEELEKNRDVEFIKIN